MILRVKPVIFALKSILMFCLVAKDSELVRYYVTSHPSIYVCQFVYECDTFMNVPIVTLTIRIYIYLFIYLNESDSFIIVCEY